MTNRVTIEGITSGEDVTRKAAWIVTLGFYPSDAYKTPMLTANFTVSKAEYDEEHIVRIARNYFHELCKHLAEETSGWALGKDGVEALKIGK